ncbi:MAG: methyltransferase domain-containing protein [Victivallaceae bacterium]|nr:methyltransferase domain-containing protein [Victivallaceae bacterium]
MPMSNHPEDEDIQIFTGVYRLFPAELLAAPRVELDLGCGTGAFAFELAGRYPSIRVLASDVMLGRLRKVVRKSRRLPAGNLTAVRCESRFLLGIMLPDRSIDRIHLLCPDPWPKDRHRAHRLVASDFASPLHRVLKDDGILHFSSDDAPYFDAVRELIENSLLFAPAREAIADVADIKTDFERRWLAEGKEVRHIAWRKLPLPPHTIGH